MISYRFRIRVRVSGHKQKRAQARFTSSIEKFTNKMSLTKTFPKTLFQLKTKREQNFHLLSVFLFHFNSESVDPNFYTNSASKKRNFFSLYFLYMRYIYKDLHTHTQRYKMIYIQDMDTYISSYE